MLHVLQNPFKSTNNVKIAVWPNDLQQQSRVASHHPNNRKVGKYETKLSLLTSWLKSYGSLEDVESSWSLVFTFEKLNAQSHSGLKS